MYKLFVSAVGISLMANRILNVQGVQDLISAITLSVFYLILSLDLIVLEYEYDYRGLAKDIRFVAYVYTTVLFVTIILIGIDESKFLYENFKITKIGIIDIYFYLMTLLVLIEVIFNLLVHLRYDKLGETLGKTKRECILISIQESIFAIIYIGIAQIDYIKFQLFSLNLKIVILLCVLILDVLIHDKISDTDSIKREVRRGTLTDTIYRQNPIRKKKREMGNYRI